MKIQPFPNRNFVNTGGTNPYLQLQLPEGVEKSGTGLDADGEDEEHQSEDVYKRQLPIERCRSR